MQQWLSVVRALVLGGAAMLLASSSQPSFAQAQTTPSVSAPNPSSVVAVDELLRRGQVLEMEGRWGDALAHFEDAMRKFPEEPSLHRRFQLARYHYDVQKRYLDTSFAGGLASLSTPAALTLYDHAMAVLSANYFDVPDWRALTQEGATNLKIALSEPAFRKHFHMTATDEQIRRLHTRIEGIMASRAIRSQSEARSAIEQIVAVTTQDTGVSGSAVVLEFLCGATNSLDPYSAFLTPNQLDEVYSQIEGNFVGLGIELKSIEHQLTIIRVIPGSPAKEAGLLAGDVIHSVDGIPTDGLTTDQAANLLQGESGTTAVLSVTTADQPARMLRVPRRRVEVPSIDGVAIVDKQFGVGYLQLSSFQKTTATDLDEALWGLYRSGMRSLVIDLRGNPGGLLATAVKVSDRFVERGVIVSTRGRSLNEDYTYSARETGTWQVPLVLLIDGDSASAAEIFAGAIRDHSRGTIVGERSYGKGSVQGIFPLAAHGCGIRLTTAKFYSPAGRAFSRVGVSPDMEVHAVARLAPGESGVETADNIAAELSSRGDIERDPMLGAAVEVARRKAVPTVRVHAEQAQPATARFQTYSNAN